MTPSEDLSAWLAGALMLQQASAAGAARPLLRGKNLGLLCAAEDTADALLFRRAGVALGARVAHIRPDPAMLGASDDPRHTARMLGRLYDAIECQGLAADLVRRIAADAGVPVCDGLASPAHASARLVDLMDTATPAADRRCFVLQAALLAMIG